MITPERCVYDQKSNCILIQVHSGYVYEVDLDRCNSPAATLDWIHQLNTKTWGPEIMAEFLKVLFERIPEEFWSGKAA